MQHVAFVTGESFVIERLPPRERQLFEALYTLKRATAVELQDALEDAPGNSAVRAMLRRLEAKGLVTHEEEKGRFIYMPAVPERRIRETALRRFVETYFGGSPIGAAAALIGMSGRVSADELRRLEEMVDRVRREEG
jgi:predicted transcriptional regulator